MLYVTLRGVYISRDAEPKTHVETAIIITYTEYCIPPHVDFRLISLFFIVGRLYMC